MGCAAGEDALSVRDQQNFVRARAGGGNRDQSWASGAPSVFHLRQTEKFKTWLEGLADKRAVERIAQRLVRLQAGLFGDAKSVGGGTSEMRIDYGPGYRIYFARRSHFTIVLLCGGDKSSQRRDIKTAKALMREIETENGD